jgi:uncharacterized protein YjbI with pentapeptide repeats
MTGRIVSSEWRIGGALSIRYSLFAIRPAAVAALLALSPAPAAADQRADFLGGRTRDCQRCDLSGANFKRHDLSGADLTGANLQQANFHDANLSGARLSGADLTGANLNKADLRRADLTDANFHDALL